MDKASHLIKVISKFSNGSKLKYNETVAVLNAVSKISEEKELIEKTLLLTEAIYNITYDKDEVLTKREMQVFELIGRGYKSGEIALILSISKATVSTHRKNIIKKLKLKGGGKLQNVAFEYIKNL